ncbi:MAG TPA: T9SS type A sorting domain-containing protein [Gemmatimonadota bacterium]|nr:T9SS type A sorting domain-containing protein [Gemmatimonadota bacterium]
MKLKSECGTARGGGWPVTLASAVLLLGVVATATGDLPKDRPHNRPDGRGLVLATTPNSFLVNRNRVIFLLQDNGEIGSSGSSVAGGGFWIAETNQYVFSSGPNIGATIPATGDTVVAIGGPFSELDGGGPTFDALGLDEYFATTNPEDEGNFPEVCTVDAFRVGQFPSLQPFAGEPFPGFADQTVCIAANDILGGTCADCGGTRVGVEIVETIFVFGVPSVQDFLFVAFRVFNSTQFLNASNAPAQPAGPYDLENMIVAIAVDPDIGEAGDDQIAFLPEVQTMVFWDVDFNEPQFQGVPGFGGITYLSTPVDPATGEQVGLQEFTVFTNGAPRPDPSSKEEWYQLMTGDITEVVLEVDPRDVRGMASSGSFTLPVGGFVEIYAAYFFANVSGSPPADLRAEAYKSLTTGALIPGANDNPAFDNFKTVQQTAQATFDAGFVVPTAPPKPATTLIPGDGQVTIVWEADPVESVNPFAKVARDPFARLATGERDPAAPPVTDADGVPVTLDADQVIFDPTRDTGGLTGFVTAGEAGFAGATVTNPAFNANFVIQDFQGFRVYRSRSGLASDAELIAQFDLSDAITGGLFCLAATAVFDEEGNFVSAVCTESAELPIGTNTGLSFSVVDRGGPFGAPGTGPGLINGIPVFYSVTSFAVNCGQSPVDLPSQEAFDVLVPPAACLVLESGLSPLLQATPRSSSSALVDASASFATLAGSGEECDTDLPTATVDAGTGEYTSFRPCSNALARSTVSVIRGTNVPTGDFFLVIDSLTLADPSQYDGGYVLAFHGPTRYWFHWEDESGALANVIQPTVGSISLNHVFTASGEAAVSFNVDTDPTDVGADISIAATFVSDYSVIEDLEVNGQSVGLLDLGGTIIGQARPHRIDGSSLASVVVIGNARGRAGTAREYSFPGEFGHGGTSFELTWSVEGGVFSGTMRNLSTGDVVPEGGQPKGPDNPNTSEDFIAGYNWGFIGPGTPDGVTNAFFPVGGPLTNEIALTPGATFIVTMPGQSVYIEGIQTLPADGDVWTFLIDSGFQRGFFGREGPAEDGSFAYNDFNQNSAQGVAIPIQAGITNPSPGQRFRLSLTGGSNEVADADLSAILVVPNPFIAANEITRGRGLQRILFTNLPPQATIRIYTISGNLVRVLEHNDGSGTAPWDVRTRFDLLVASGNYYYHVTTPDGRTHLGRFAVVN